MYVPDCQDITCRNMFYAKNEETGMFDTRDAAQNILWSVAESHKEQLKVLPQQLPGGNGSLLDLCSLTDAATDVRPPPCVATLAPEHGNAICATPLPTAADSADVIKWTPNTTRLLPSLVMLGIEEAAIPEPTALCAQCLCLSGNFCQPESSRMQGRFTRSKTGKVHLSSYWRCCLNAHAPRDNCQPQQPSSVAPLLLSSVLL
jgi:hypothetical protein